MKSTLCLLLVLAATSCSPPADEPATQALRTAILTDINLIGGDPDDRQSWLHVLWYANELDIEVMIPDYWDGQGQEATHMGLDAYQEDFNEFNFEAKGYPTRATIEERIAKSEDDAIQRLVDAATNSTSPLYVLVWGQMTTLKEALVRHPEIASNLRVLSIATGLKYGPRDEVPGEDCTVTNWNGNGRQEIFDNFPDLWWIESNWTYNGMFMGERPNIMFEKLSQYGAMGRQIKTVTERHEWAQYFRVGDTPTVLYLIDDSHDVDDPETSSWAGKFKKPFPEERPNYYTDDNGLVEWDYADPCSTWENLEEMYAYNKSTLFDEREGMYDALLERLDDLYGK